MDTFDDLAPWWRRRRFVVGLLVATLAIWIAAFYQSKPSPVWVEGQTVQKEPQQEDSERDTWEGPKGSVITPLAEYNIEARVLGRKDYSDEGAFLAPVDLALGWGDMSNEAVLSQLEFRQSGRWYHYSWDTPQPPIDLKDMIQQSANTHIAPGNDQVADLLDQVVEGDRVRLRGFLISVKRPDGWRWQSSLSRNDSGNGACELFWVETLEILPVSDQTVDAPAIGP